MTQRYIDYFPKPLLQDLVNGRWLPVVGAGMSLNADLPSPAKMPLWPEMGKMIADELLDYSPTSVLDGISAYEHEFGRARLVERLVDLLHIDRARPGNAHKEFCSLPFDIVCTTNFDFLLEKQYDAEYVEKRSVHPVVDEDQLSINMNSVGTLLLKLHGDVRHPSRLVVTEADYDGFLSNFPLIATYLSNLLITKTAVFIGYSLDDPDFRQIWHVVSSRLGRSRRVAYAIMVGAKPGDVARFERRGVKVVNLPGSRERYGDILAEAFTELREYRRDHAGVTIKATEEKPLEQLLLPRDAMTRLCLFATPLDVLPFYREHVFPIAEAAGFVPITAADVINLGDSISAKIDTLIDRAAIMIVDATSPSTQFELALAAGRSQEVGLRVNRQKLNIISVTTEHANTSSRTAEYKIIRRDRNISDDELFLRNITFELNALATEAGIAQKQRSEPRRLFDAKEYRASVISAMTLLETVLRQYLGGYGETSTVRPVALRHLIEMAMRSDIVNYNAVDLNNWIKMRNEVVHSGRSVSRNEAKMIVDGVEDIVHQII